MNKLESTIYNLVRKNPALKQFVRNMYQDIFDLLPRKKEYFASPYQYREGFFFGFHDVTPFSFDETKLLANQNRLDLRMPLQCKFWIEELPDQVQRFITLGGYRLYPDYIKV